MPLANPETFNQILIPAATPIGSPIAQVTSDKMHLMGIDRMTFYLAVADKGAHTTLFWSWWYSAVVAPSVADDDWGPLTIDDLDRTTGLSPQRVYVPNYNIVPLTAPFTCPPLEVSGRRCGCG